MYNESLGALYDALSEWGKLDDTLLIALSDNGEAKGSDFESARAR